MKHILNNISQEEKDRILEQHRGGKELMIENFNKLLNNKLGTVEPLLNEQTDRAIVSIEKGSIVRPDGRTWKTIQERYPPIELRPNEKLAKSFSSDCQLFIRYNNKMYRINKSPYPFNFEQLKYIVSKLQPITPQKSSGGGNNNAVQR